MRGGTTVWVGRVKSTVAPSLLQDAFAKVGKVLRVETGFAGFAFVEFETEEDAEKAAKQMNKVTVAHVGEIRVAKATIRGYEDALAKRDDYWRNRGGCGHLSIGPGGERDKRKSRSRSGADSRSRSRIRDRYGSSGSGSASRSKSLRRDGSHRRRSRSYSKASRLAGSARRESPPRAPGSPQAGGAQDPRARSARPAAPQGGAAGRSPSRPRAATESGGDVVPWAGRRDRSGSPAAGEDLALEGNDVQLSTADRHEVVCFFDGTSAPELLLEGAAVLKVPDYFVPNVLNGLPHGFQGVSQEGAMMLMKALSSFSSSSEVSSEGAASVEVRQALVVDANGRRMVRKSILIDGTTYSSEERALPG